MTIPHDDSIGYPTSITNRNIIRFLSAHLKQFDITPEQWTVLKRLCEKDGINQKEVSQRTEKDQPTVTRILDILERKELVRKKLNGEDRRSFLIFITDKGRRQYEQVKPFIEELFEQRLLRGISQGNLEIFKEVLSQINENIAEDLE